jgi:protein tyrosine/serine phosphatase
MYWKKPFKPLSFFVFLVIVITFSFTALDPSYSKTVVERPGTWATAIVKEGLPNFFKVSDTFYRGAQPTRTGFLELKKMGIKTIINLREYHTDEKLINGIGFTYFQMPTSRSKPLMEHYQKFLDIVKNPDLQPVFVHCRHGADRTGTAVALYRKTVEGWDTEEAIRELQQGGYGYRSVFKEIIKFIRNFNEQPQSRGD